MSPFNKGIEHGMALVSQATYLCCLHLQFEINNWLNWFKHILFGRNGLRGAYKRQWPLHWLNYNAYCEICLYYF